MSSVPTGRLLTSMPLNVPPGAWVNDQPSSLEPPTE